MIDYALAPSKEVTHVSMVEEAALRDLSLLRGEPTERPGMVSTPGDERTRAVFAIGISTEAELFRSGTSALGAY